MDPNNNNNNKIEEYKKKEKKSWSQTKKLRLGEREVYFNFFYFILFSLRYTEFRSLDFIGPRMKSALLDEGYT